MAHRILLIVTVLSNALLGHLCMMPMAMATEMVDHHDAAMEMVMSPLEPMSPVHCEHCGHLAKEQLTQTSAGCAGHCLTQAGDIGPTVFQYDPPSLASPPSAFMNAIRSTVELIVSKANAPPPIALLERTTVFLL